MAEIEELMSISLASFEQGNSADELVITVRVAWSEGEGIYAEALSYGYGGDEWEVGQNHRMDAFIKHCVATNYTETYLVRILSDSEDFEDARRYLMAEMESDRQWARARLL